MKMKRKWELDLGTANNINIPYWQRLGSVGHAKLLIKLVSPQSNKKEFIPMSICAILKSLMEY